MNAGQVVVYITGNITGLTSALGQGMTAINRWKGNVHQFGNSLYHNVNRVTSEISRATRIQGFVIGALGATVVRTYKEIITEGAALEKQFNNIVQALASEDDMTFEQSKEKALEFQEILREVSMQYGMTLTDANEMMINALQNGLDATTEKVHLFAQAAAELVTGDPLGTATLADAGEILSRVQNLFPELRQSFKNETDYYRYLVDEVISVTNQGQTSVAQYAQNITELFSIARVGLDGLDPKGVFEDINSMFVRLSRLTTPGEAATQIRAILTSLAKETRQSQKVANDLGIEWSLAAVEKAGGLSKFLQETYTIIERRLIPGTREYNELLEKLGATAAANRKSDKGWQQDMLDARKKYTLSQQQLANLNLRERQVMLERPKDAAGLLARQQKLNSIMIERQKLLGKMEDASREYGEAEEAAAISRNNGMESYNAEGRKALQMMEDLKNGRLTEASIVNQMLGRIEGTQGVLNTVTKGLQEGQQSEIQKLTIEREGMRLKVLATIEEKLKSTSVLLGRIGTTFSVLVATIFDKNQANINEFLTGVVDMLTRAIDLVNGAVKPANMLEEAFVWLTNPEGFKFVGMLGVAATILGPLMVVVSTISDTIGFLFLTLKGLMNVLSWFFLYGPSALLEILYSLITGQAVLGAANKKTGTQAVTWISFITVKLRGLIGWFAKILWWILKISTKFVFFDVIGAGLKSTGNLLAWLTLGLRRLLATKVTSIGNLIIKGFLKNATSGLLGALNTITFNLKNAFVNLLYGKISLALRQVWMAIRFGIIKHIITLFYFIRSVLIRNILVIGNLLITFINRWIPGTLGVALDQVVFNLMHAAKNVLLGQISRAGAQIWAAMWNGIFQRILILLRSGLMWLVRFVWRYLIMGVWWLVRTVFVSVIWPALVWIGGAIAAVVGAIAAAVGLPVWVVVVIILAIVAVIVGIIWYFWDSIVAWGTALWNYLQPLALALWEMIQAFWESVLEVAYLGWNILTLIFKWIWIAIKAWVGLWIGILWYVWQAISSFFSWLWESAVWLFGKVWERLSNFFASVGEFFADFWEIIGPYVEAWWQNIKDGLDGVLSIFGTSVDEIVAVVQEQWTWLDDNILKVLWKWVGDFFNYVELGFNALMETIFPNLDGIVSRVKTLTDFFKNVTASAKKANELIDKAHQFTDNVNTGGRAFASGRISPRLVAGSRVGDVIPARLMPGESVLTAAETQLLAGIGYVLSGKVLTDLLAVTDSLVTVTAGGMQPATAGGGAPIHQTFNQNNTIYNPLDLEKASRDLARRARMNKP